MKRGDHKPHPLLPGETSRFRKLYKGRGGIEREGLGRVRLHTDLTILAKPACALSRARAVPLAA